MFAVERLSSKCGTTTKLQSIDKQTNSKVSDTTAGAGIAESYLSWNLS